MLTSLNHRRLAVGAENLLEGFGYLLDGRVGADGLQDRVHRVLVAPGRLFELFEPPLDEGVVTPLFEVLQALELAVGDLGVYAVDLHLLFILRLVDVDVDHVALSLLELALVAGAGLGDLAHREAGLDGLYHPAHLVYLPEVIVGLALELIRQSLDEVRAT